MTSDRAGADRIFDVLPAGDQCPGPGTKRGRDDRLTYRLLAYWDERRGERDFPRLREIDPADIEDMWPHCFVLDVRCFGDSPYFHYLGASLAKFSGIFLSGNHDWSSTLLRMAVCHFREAMSRRGPILVEDELTLYDTRKLLFRSTLLPLSDNGQDIDHILGAATGKIVRPA